jgi:glycosyltransferase involved in cell wall biosynthesis
MRVSLATYPWAFGTPGGGERQLQFYLAALNRGQRKWPELEFELFDQWQPAFPGIKLMHYFSCMPSSRDFVGYVKETLGIPLVVSPNFWPDPEGWRASGVYEDVAAILWLANKVVVNSRIEEEALVRLCNIDSSRISVVPNAVEDCFFETVPQAPFRNAYGIDRPFVLNVGNVEPRKNQLAFLKALRFFPALQLVTIGFAREQWYLDACRVEGGAQFRLIEPLPPGSELIRSAIAGSEFFAMPSLRETPGIATLEAGAAGAKILTTDLGSPTEYFEDHAVYVNPYDINSMRDGIAEVIARPADNNLTERIRALYRWDIVVEQLVNTYYSVLGGDASLRSEN